MKATLFDAIAALALASSLSACASFSVSEPEWERLAAVHPGLTKDEVASIAGRPGVKTGTRSHGEMWVYSANDEWAEKSEYDVTFDAKGIVTDVTAALDD